MDAITKAKLNKLDERITSSLSGISNVELVGNNILRFTNAQDGSTFDVKLPFDMTTIEIVDILPTATDKLVNKVYFLLSDDHFYKCINVGGVFKFKDVTPSSSSGEGIVIYDNYNLLPKTLEKEAICYVKNDYTDASSNTTYKKGFYLYNTTTSKWESISGQSESISTSNYTEEITASSKIWHIQHNLNSEWWKLQINIIDDEGNVVYGDVDLDKTTNNLLVLVFETAIQGKIYIKK